MKWGIASRFATIFSLLVLLATGTVGYMVYQGARQSLIDSATDRLANTAKIMEVRFNASIDGISKDVRFLAATPPVQGLVRIWTGRRRGIKLDPETAISDKEWRGQLAETFEVFLRNRPSYYRARFINLNDGGRELVRVEKHNGETVRVPTEGLGEFSDSTLQREIASLPGDKMFLSEIEISREGDKAVEPNVPVMKAALPIYSANGRVFGVMVIDVDLRTVIDALRELARPDKSLFVAKNQGGLLEVPPEYQRISKPVNSLVTLFPESARLVHGDVDKTRIEYAVTGAESPSIAYFERIRLERGVGHDNLILGVTSPHSSVLEGVRRVRDRSVLITLLFSIGGIVLAMGFSGFLTHPLMQVTRAISNFGNRDNEENLPVGRGDEIGVLARAFTTMASQIQDQVRELEDKELRQRIILETSAEGMVVVNAEGSIETFNRAAERMFGYHTGELSGKSVRDLILPVMINGVDGNESSSETEAERWKTTGTGHEVIGRRQDGSQFPASLSVSAFELLGERKYAVFIEDITERKRYEEALQRAKEEAEEMARLKTAFLANMSHEIRTPLTSVIGYASVLAKEVSDKHKRFAQLIERSGRRLMDTLNSVMALAQLEAKKVDVQFDLLNVADEAREFIQLYQQFAHQKGLKLIYEVDASAENVTARLDRGAFSSIMQNLIGNAIKFTETGGISVTVSSRHRKVFLQIRDTGVGIDPSFLPHLFEEFRQESTGLSRTYEGSGLGLSITQKLVTLMGGEIYVDSKKGEGSVFTVVFPVAVDENEAKVVEHDTAESMLTQIEHSEVLLVEDNPDTAFLILHLLLDICDVTLAANGTEAVRKAERKRFDAVLLDINLGRSEVLHKIRAIPGYENVPAAAITAYALPGDRERFIAAGFDTYLSKPFTAEGLIETIVELIPG
jgi:PAS domain S-box-containing protein